MPNFKVGAARDLPTSDNDTWDGPAAATAVFAWAGGDDFDPAKARRAFLLYDSEATDQRGAYKLPFARPIDGTLTAIKGGVRAAKSRLRQTDAPEDVLDRAEAILDTYWNKMDGGEESKATVPSWFTRRPEQDRIEFRAADIEPTEDGFTGHAATFMTADSYWTAFAKGAFRKTLRDRGDRLPVLWQHWPDFPIGRHVAIKEDRDGLFVDVALADDGAEGTTALKRLRHGVPLGLSFGFQTVKDRSAEDGDEIDLSQLPKSATRDDIRVITEVRLWETSVVTFPANEAAAITAVRNQREADALTLFLADLKANRLTDEQRTLGEQIVTAWGEAAGAGTDHSTDAEARRKARDRSIAIALAQSQGWLSAGAIHV